MTTATDDPNDRFHLMFANRSEHANNVTVYLKRSGTEYALFQVGKFQDSTGTPAITLPQTLIPGDILKVADASTATVEIWGITYRLK